MLQMTQTRGKGEKSDVCFADALLNPSASFGGLYTFSTLPHLTPQMLQEFENLSYTELCKRVFEILGLGLDEGLLDFALQAYEGFDETSAPVRLAHKIWRSSHLGVSYRLWRVASSISFS